MQHARNRTKIISMCSMYNKRTIPNDRYKIKSQHATIIEKKFLQKTTNEDVLCRKCRYICETQSFATQESKSDTSGPSEPCKRMKTSGCASPSSITLSIPSTSKSHANCVICKKTWSKAHCCDSVCPRQSLHTERNVCSCRFEVLPKTYCRQ